MAYAGEPPLLYEADIPVIFPNVREDTTPPDDAPYAVVL